MADEKEPGQPGRPAKPGAPEFDPRTWEVTLGGRTYDGYEYFTQIVRGGRRDGGEPGGGAPAVVGPTSFEDRSARAYQLVQGLQADGVLTLSTIARFRTVMELVMRYI